MKNTQTYKLLYPFELNGTDYEEFSYRRVKTKDQVRVSRAHSGDEAMGEVQLVADCCETTTDVIEELDWEDFDNLRSQISSGVTGKKPPKA